MQISNQQIAILLAKSRITLENIILEGLKKDSIVIAISKQIDPENFYNTGKKILKRISTKKFQKYWQEINLGTSENEEIAIKKEEEPHSKDNFNFLTEIDIERKLIVDENNHILEEDRTWTQNFYKSVASKIPCSLSIKRKEIYPDRLWIRCYCRSPKCDLVYVFNSEIDQNIPTFNFKVSVKGTYDEAKHEVKARSISGKKRRDLADKVMQYGAKQVQNEIILSQDLSSINSASENTVKTLAALSQMKSQKLGFSDFDSDDIIDIMSLKKLTDLMPSSQADVTPAYIQYLRCDNLLVSWGYNSQIEHFLANKSRVVSIDATGNLTRSFHDGARRQFYYSIVYKNDITGDICPLMQCISSSHDVSSLLNPFNIFSRKLKLISNSQNAIKVAVLDFSFALMQVASQAFNGCNLYIYLLMMHKKVILNETLHLDFVVLPSCSTHVIKFISDKSKDLQKDHKQIVMINFTKALLAESYSEYLDCFSDLYIGLKSEYIPLDILEKLNRNAGKGKKNDELIASLKPNDELVEFFDSDDFTIKSSLYVSLPYVTDLEATVQKKLQAHSNIINNRLKDDSLANYFIRKLAPFCVLWSSFAHKRETNSYIENHHKVIKNDLIKYTNIKPGRAIKELRTEALSQMVRIRSSPSFRPRKQPSKSIPDPVENFKPPKAPKVTIFEKTRVLEKSLISPAYQLPDMKIIYNCIAAFDTEYSNKLFTKNICGIKVSKRDLKTLKGKNWLNDKIIYAYLKLKTICYPDILVLDHSFYMKICGAGLHLSSTLYKNIPFFERSSVLFIIHRDGFHWAIVHFDVVKLELRYLDSLNFDGQEVLVTIANFLNLIYSNLHGKPSDTLKINTENLSPIQNNGFDCGIYAIINCLYIIERRKLNSDSYNHDVATKMRSICKYDIINHKET